MLLFFFFFNDTATTEIYTLSLHDALPIFLSGRSSRRCAGALSSPSRCWWRLLHRRERPAVSGEFAGDGDYHDRAGLDRKSTRLNSSHVRISYAVFCLKKKKKLNYTRLLLA